MPTKSDQHYPFFLAGTWRHSERTAYSVRCPYDDSAVGIVSMAGAAELEHAIQAAVAAFAQTSVMPSHRRAAILRAVSQGLEERAEEFARSIALEAGKPIKQARAEVQRAIFTFAQAAEEATRIPGEIIHLDAFPTGEGRRGIVQRFPVGPIAAITPFNFPLNLVAHKLAPAMAAGCPVVLKPSPQTPITALKLAEVIHAAGWPAGALSVLPLAVADAAPLIEDERFKLLTFTGGLTGWKLKQQAGRKRVLLELGGNAGVMVHCDADLTLAAQRCVAGGFSYAGQSCISVQRICVHESVYEAFMDQFLIGVRALKVGHPLDEASDLSTVINDQAAQRVAAWLDEARGAGAEVVAGGT
ncbi:MAG: aldehyde dehydrogenase family protein, partial [Chloroflexaceae bacterium]|nr:aldehyde dehydrogenase family protein [Chloroflexaceae bacterium]